MWDPTGRVRPQRLRHSYEIPVRRQDKVSFKQVSPELGIARRTRRHFCKHLQKFESPSQPEARHPILRYFVQPEATPSYPIRQCCTRVEIRGNPLVIRVAWA